MFRSYLDAATDETFGAANPTQPNTTTHTATDDAVAGEPHAEPIDQSPRDFIARVFLTDLSNREFGEFTADLLRATGYQARVTPYSEDGAWT